MSELVWVLDMNHQIANKMTAERRRRRLEIKEIARGAGVNRSSMYNWMDGVPTLPADSAVKLAEYFGCGVWDLWRIEQRARE